MGGCRCRPMTQELMGSTLGFEPQPVSQQDIPASVPAGGCRKVVSRRYKYLQHEY